MNITNLIYLAMGVLGVFLALRLFNGGIGAVDKKEVISHIKEGVTQEGRSASRWSCWFQACR